MKKVMIMTKNDKFQIATAVIAVIIVIVAWCMTDTPTPAHAPDSIELATTNNTTTTTTSTTTSTTTTTTTTTTTVTTVTTLMTTTTATVEYDFKDRLINYGWFVGKYYHGETAPCNGGSGNQLIDCTPKAGETKGSVACRRIFEDYGYTVNGRTRVYLEFESYPEMTGWYFVDDCCQSMDVVDVYFIDYSTCPWQNDGNTDVHLWVEPS